MFSKIILWIFRIFINCRTRLINILIDEIVIGYRIDSFISISEHGL